MDKEKVKSIAFKILILLHQHKFTEVETVALLKTIAEMMNREIEKNNKDA